MFSILLCIKTYSKNLYIYMFFKKNIGPVLKHGLTAHVLSQPHVCENTLKPKIPNPSKKIKTAASRVLDKAKTKTHIKTKRKIERDNVSRNVYEKTRQSRGFEAVEITRGHVWCLGCCAPCHSLCSSLPLR